MRSSLVAAFLLVLATLPLGAEYQTALPGYRYEFPRDHFNHPEYQTEWWYYTGNLRATDGHRFGFELTFFRQAVNRDPAKGSDWDIRDLYLAHLALSDLDAGEFYHTERLNRAGPGLAGASDQASRVWNGNWQVQWSGQQQELLAIADNFTLQLTMNSAKPPVIHGQNGVRQKATGAGHASHYISFTRLLTKGSIELNGETYRVEGTSWMDHEFFTHSLAADQAGWDWLSLQLDDNTELMLYRFRRKDGSIDAFSSGTYVDAQGKSRFLNVGDFSMQPQGVTWTSAATHATYPVEWRVTVPSIGIDLRVNTPLTLQELVSGNGAAPSYWEGAITITGTRDGAPAKGVGYLEMTGYSRPVVLGFK